MHQAYLFCACTRVTSDSSAFLLFVLSSFFCAIDGRLFDGLCHVLFGPEQDLERLPWLRPASGREASAR